MISALLLVGLLQCVNVVVGFVGLEEIGGRSTEISIAGIQRTYEKCVARLWYDEG